MRQVLLLYQPGRIVVFSFCFTYSLCKITKKIVFQMGTPCHNGFPTGGVFPFTQPKIEINYILAKKILFLVGKVHKSLTFL